MQAILREKQKTRLTVLHKLYELSDGHTDKHVNGGALANSCSIADGSQFKEAVNYLEGEYLVEIKLKSGGMPAFVQITHAGVLEVERAFSEPDRPTDHFLPVNVLYVNQMIGSSVQQGTVSSTLTSTAHVSNNAKDELAAFVERAALVLSTSVLQTPLWKEVKADVDTLRVQTESPSPKASIIRECLASVGRLCEGAAAGAVGNQLATYIPALLKLFA